MQIVSPASSVRTMTKVPSKKEGEFCRVKVDGSTLESIILDVMDAEQKVRIKTLGFSDDMTLPIKELLPSQGREAREKQIAAASEIYGGIKWALKDQCMAPFGPSQEMKLSGMKHNCQSFSAFFY